MVTLISYVELKKQHNLLVSINFVKNVYFPAEPGPAL